MDVAAAADSIFTFFSACVALASVAAATEGAAEDDGGFAAAPPPLSSSPRRRLCDSPLIALRSALLCGCGRGRGREEGAVERRLKDGERGEGSKEHRRTRLAMQQEGTRRRDGALAMRLSFVVFPSLSQNLNFKTSKSNTKHPF